MLVSAPRVLVAGTSSGCGKTTVTCGLLVALVRRGLRVRAHKCGPDYLDPMFHERVLGTPSSNLDLFLGDEALVRRLVARGASEADVTVVEGAMGYYDGIAGGLRASAYDVARATGTPVVLVVDAHGRSLSAAAEVLGFARLRTSSMVAGVVLNRVSASRASLLRSAIEEHAGVRVLGYVPALEEARLEHRHLGLVSAPEVLDLRQRVDVLARVMAQTVDLDALLEVALSAADLRLEPVAPTAPRLGHPTIAVARDEAFCFYYPQTLELLERLGARVAFFSPLRDARLPEDASGLYLGGGYPELHVRELCRNADMIRAIRAVLAEGMPTIAECGGFLYLHERLEDDNGTSWPMVGAVRGRAYRREGHGRFGYITLEARRDCLLARAGDRLRAHEFHYWESDCPGDAFWAQKPQSERGWDCVTATDSLYAGFPHLYLAGSPAAAARFVDACARHACRGEVG